MQFVSFYNICLGHGQGVFDYSVRVEGVERNEGDPEKEEDEA